VSTTTTETNAAGLRDQITGHEGELAEAEREIGAAALDGKSPVAATKRAREARDGIGRARAALEELERREEAAAEEARTGEASRARLASYEWMVGFMELVGDYLTRRAEFEAAKVRLQQMPIDNRFRRAKLGGRYHSTDESDLDTELLHAMPDPSGWRSKTWTGIAKSFTPERARELRGFAEVRAEEERSGNGVDRSQPYGTWDREMNERRKAERAQRAEELAAAEERSITEPPA
jgi:hypothetical protein